MIVVCEGYTDVIAMHQAGVANCVGIMGTALPDEQVALLASLAPTVVLALDADGAGQAAMLKAAAAIAARGKVELRVAPLAAGRDPADVLVREGGEALAAIVGQAVAFVQFRVERILAGGDLQSPEGRDKALAALRPVFAELGLGAMREELEREVAGRLGVSERTVEALLVARGGAGAVAGGVVAQVGAPDPSERVERGFLALCLALPQAGPAALAELDIEGLFASPLTRRAADRLRENIEAPLAGLGDAELERLLTELSVRASRLDPTPAQLEVARRQLELARIERAIDTARAGASEGVELLGRERAQVKLEIDDWMLRALEQTAGAR